MDATGSGQGQTTGANILADGAEGDGAEGLSWENFAAWLF